MSFIASNDRIRVVDNGATVFDTNDDIPHILGTGYYNVTVTFPQPSLFARIDTQQIVTQNYNALEWVQQYILGDLPFGQSCNFFLIKATAVRTVVGGTNAQPEDLIATVGNETFSFQGSALLEVGGEQSGSRFLSRIISVIPDNVNKKLILEAKHSNKHLAMPYESGEARSLSSTFSVSLTVYFGRFR